MGKKWELRKPTTQNKSVDHVQDDFGDDDFFDDFDLPPKKKQKKSKKENKKENTESKQLPSAPVEYVEDDNFNKKKKNKTEKETEKRKANNSIISNRGLTRSRPRNQKTPRKKLRMKYEKALKKRRSMMPSLRDKSAPYGGELTGIKKSIVRSKKF